MLPLERDKTGPVHIRLDPVCSCCHADPSMQPGEFSAMPLSAQPPQKIHMRWARDTQVARSPCPLGSHCLLGPFSSGSAPHEREPASLPALQRFEEIGRAQEWLRAEPAAGSGRFGQRRWSVLHQQPRLPIPTLSA